VIPLDGSELAEASLPIGATLGASAHADLTLLTVVSAGSSIEVERASAAYLEEVAPL
jgi:hypothetical protein